MRRTSATALRSIFAAAACALASREAAADPPRTEITKVPAPKVELRYVVAAGIAGCLPEPAFRDAVRRRLADDPFAPGGPVVITTEIMRQGSRLRASVSLYENGGESEATQEIFAAPNECATLSAAASLAVSLAIERSRSHARLAPREEPPREEPPLQPQEQRREEQRPRPEPTPRAVRRPPVQPRAPLALQLRTHASVTGGVGVLPDVSVGESFGASLKVDRWSAGLEAGAWLPTSVTSSSRSDGARAWLVFLSGSACAYLDRLFVCGLGTLGDFRASGTGRLLSRGVGSTYVAVGARVGIELPLARPFSIFVHGSLLAPLLRPALRIDDELLWRAPVVAGELAFGLRMSIL